MRRLYQAPQKRPQRSRVNATLGPVPKFELPPDRPRRPHPRDMTKAEQVAELVDAWPKLNAAETAAVLGALRRCPAIAGRTHVSKLGKVKKGTHLVGRPDAAKLLGISPWTLDAWYQRGWITGKLTISHTTWYPKSEVTKARKLAEKRRGKPQ